MSYQIIFDPPSPELIGLQAAVNKELVGIAKVNLFARTVGDNPKQWCVLIQDDKRRWTRESDVPLRETDKDEIVQIAKDCVLAPKPLASRYTTDASEADEKFWLDE